MDESRPARRNRRVGRGSGSVSDSWRNLFRFRARVGADIEFIVGGVSFIAILLTWLMLSEIGLVNHSFCPRPSRSLKRFIDSSPTVTSWPTSGYRSSASGLPFSSLP
jgi:hypothetical protein